MGDTSSFFNNLLGHHSRPQIRGLRCLAARHGEVVSRRVTLAILRSSIPAAAAYPPKHWPVSMPAAASVGRAMVLTVRVFVPAHDADSERAMRADQAMDGQMLAERWVTVKQHRRPSVRCQAPRPVAAGATPLYRTRRSGSWCDLSRDRDGSNHKSSAAAYTSGDIRPQRCQC
jgi:hypothetical protein